MNRKRANLDEFWEHNDVNKTAGLVEEPIQYELSCDCKPKESDLRRMDAAESRVCFVRLLTGLLGFPFCLFDDLFSQLVRHDIVVGSLHVETTTTARHRGE